MTTPKEKSDNDNDANATAFTGRELSESELESVAGGCKHPDGPCDHPDPRPQLPK
jgi:hypothetical protein